MMHRVLALLAVLHSTEALPKTCYPDVTKTWGGELPGDVSVYTPNPGLAMTPPASVHGAAVYVGWQMTNNFLRYWSIFYGIFSLRGEPKHGLWKWTLPSASTSFWWCELGGIYGGNNGLADGPNQKGMEPVWDQLRKSPKLNEIGPLGQAAKISTLSNDIIRVNLATSVNASIFRMLQGGQYSRILNTTKLELYLFTGYYNWPQMFDVVPCDAGQEIGENGCNGLKHTFIAALYDNDYNSSLGLPGFGLHYEGDTGCPETCGAGGCNCDAVLLDFALDANIVATPAWNTDIFYIPDRSNASCWEDYVPDVIPEPEAEPELEASPPSAPPLPASIPSACLILDADIDTWCPNVDPSSWHSTISIDAAGDPGCPAFVWTNGITCQAFCAQFSLGCLRAQDNDDATVCNVKSPPEEHLRQSTADNGCLQSWEGQVCVCSSGLSV